MKYLIYLLFLLAAFSVRSQEKTDLAEIVNNDDPKAITGYFRSLDDDGIYDHAGYKIGRYTATGKAGLKLFAIPVNTITVTLADSKVGQIHVYFKGLQHFKKLKGILQKQFGDPVPEKEAGLKAYKWFGKEDFHYVLSFVPSPDGPEKTEFQLTIEGEVIRKINRDRTKVFIKNTTIDAVVTENNPQLIFDHKSRFAKREHNDKHKLTSYVYKGIKNQNTIRLFGIPVESIEVVLKDDDIIFIDVELEESHANIKHIKAEFIKYLGPVDQESSIEKGSQRIWYFNRKKTGFMIDAFYGPDNYDKPFNNEGSLHVGYITESFYALREE